MVLNSVTRWHSIWINLYYPFCYIGNLWSVSAEWTNFFHRGRYLERRKKLKTVNDIKACNKTTAKHYIIILINKKKLKINIFSVSYIFYTIPAWKLSLKCVCRMWKILLIDAEILREVKSGNTVNDIITCNKATEKHYSNTSCWWLCNPFLC